MRHFKRICFFLYSCALFACGFLCSSRLDAFFYPGKESSRKAYETPGFLTDMPDDMQKEEAKRVSFESGSLTAFAKMTVCICDLDEKISREETVRLPARLIGCSRAETEQFLKQFTEAPSLKEREAGFLNAELLSFSTERIVVRKNYRKLEKPSSFQMVVERNMVTVYEQETGILYMRTAVDARSLPSGIRSRILDGCEDVSAGSLEKFLVSYAEA